MKATSRAFATMYNLVIHHALDDSGTTKKFKLSMIT